MHRRKELVRRGSLDLLQGVLFRERCRPEGGNEVQNFNRCVDQYPQTGKKERGDVGNFSSLTPIIAIGGEA
jgi:hypothetical protein